MNVQRLLRRLGMLLVLLALGVTAMTMRFLFEGGLFHRVTPHFSGTCSSLDLAGDTINDIVIDQAAGAAYLSTSNPAESDGKTRLKRIDLKAETWVPEPVLADAPSDFSPEGLALFTDLAGHKRLFVVNHTRGERYTMEMFDPTADGKWTHVATLRDTRFRNPGDLAAVGPDQFYLANRSNARNVFDRIVEMLLGRGRSTLVYHDSERSNVTVADMAGADGIGVSPDTKALYVAETLTRKIQTFKREPYIGTLSQGQVISLPGAPHHVDVASDGSLWIAASPQFIWAEPAPTKPAPTQILQVKNPGSDTQTVSEVYADSGDQFSSATVAATFGNKLLMGSPVESRLQVCTLP